jgi:uncharacterized protein
MKQRILYVTGFRQHAGKTITCLGFLHLLKERFDPEDLGYIKPVGQELAELDDGRKVDKDALIIERFSCIPEVDMTAVSPVQLDGGFTKGFIDSKDRVGESKRLKSNIRNALDRLKGKKVIIAEGTGHPGVGGIVGLSNAHVGNLMKADIIFLSGGGIGKALDMLEVDLSYFLFRGSNVRGIIFNKLIPSKIPTVRQYITEELINDKYGAFQEPLGVFGFMPEMTKLKNPSMRSLLLQFSGSRSIGDPDGEAWQLPCNNIRVLSLAVEFLQPEKHIKEGDVVLLGAASRSRRSKLLSYERALEKGRHIAGIILTCGKTIPLDPQIEMQVRESGIPAIYVQEDTAEAEEILIKAFSGTKMQPYDSLKYEIVKELFTRYFDFGAFCRKLNL